jgi:hypothetical protein
MKVSVIETEKHNELTAAGIASHREAHLIVETLQIDCSRSGEVRSKRVSDRTHPSSDIG